MARRVKYSPHMMTKTSLLLSLCLLSSACVSDPDPGSGAPGGDGIASQSAAVGASGTVTIRGKVFYNDRRNDGLFSTRRDPNGNPGTRCKVNGTRDDGSACSENWLGAHYAVVDVIERDEGYGPLDVDCKQEDLIKSVAIASDGSFTATFTHTDRCDHDDRSRLAIALRVRLRYCGEDWGCFSINTSSNNPYFLWYPGATSSAPLQVSDGDDRTLSRMNFNPAGSSPTVANNTTKAVNYYASIVDTITTLNRDGGIPFYKDSFGEIQYVFPSTQTSTATAKSPTLIVISSTLDPSWPDGHTPAHEYGHVLMQRAWDGDYGFDGVGISCGDSSECVSRQIDFKEAWAEFIGHAVFDDTEGCGRSSFDDNASTPVPGALGSGASFRLNVTKALCDWYDTRNDDDSAKAGAGDHFAADDIYSMWFNLRSMYTQRAAYGGDYSGEGLWFCDYVDYYTEVRKSVSAVGAASHDEYQAKITDLIFNNNIACNRPTP